jgi:hypothetical protein
VVLDIKCASHKSGGRGEADIVGELHDSSTDEAQRMRSYTIVLGGRIEFTLPC